MKYEHKRGLKNLKVKGLLQLSGYYFNSIKFKR